jgi:GntR family transcriptional repressor for pyruvate dehydrogenase complex
VLETYAVEIAAKNVTAEDLQELESVHQDFCQQIDQGFMSYDEDLVFHIKIAECTKNPVLKALVTLLASDDLRLHKEFETHLGKTKILERRRDAIQEHEKILAALQAREPAKAVQAMQAHYRKSKVFREKERIGTDSR